MKLTTKMRYATRALLELALHDRDALPLSLHEIAFSENISIKYLEVLASTLRSAGYIRSVRGAAGGYKLARLPGDITLKQVYELFEGSDGFVVCTSDHKLCERSGTCAAQSVWSEMFDTSMKYLEGVTLADLVARDARLRQEANLMYDI